MSKEAARIRAKYPSHYPAVCVSDNDGAVTRKLLVPGNMSGKEFESVVRDRCDWACADSLLKLNGETISITDSVSDIYSRHSAADGFLYVTVSSSSAAEKIPDASGSTQGKVATESEQIAPEPVSQCTPPTFHMPDHDKSHELQPASGDAHRARKLIKKYPDRVPVLVNQAASAGLPCINKKFIVPRSMTVSGLQRILPGHLAFPADLHVEWNLLQIFMGDERIPEDATMNEVHNQYVDEDDGGLHITLKIEGLRQLQEPVAMEATVEAGNCTEKPGAQSSPPVFHMPDHDQKQGLQSASEEAQRARKVFKKYPDRVPVLVNQAASTSLPCINKKLLVPQSMTVSGLQGILPKHLALADDAQVNWSMLRIFMGEEPIPEDAVMGDVYRQYVDEDDGGLHVTLSIDNLNGVKRKGEEEAPAACARQLKDACQNLQNAADSANYNGASEGTQNYVLDSGAACLADQLADVQLQLQRADNDRISESSKTAQAHVTLREAELQLAAEVEKAEQCNDLQRKLQADLLLLRTDLQAQNQQSVLESEKVSQLGAALQAAESKLAEEKERAEQQNHSREKMQAQILKLERELEAKTQESIADSDNVSQLCAALDAAEAKLASESEKAERHHEVQQRLQDELLSLQKELEAMKQNEICESENTSRLRAALHGAEARLAAEAEKAEQQNEFQESMWTKILALQKELETKDQEIECKSEKISQLCSELETKDQEIEKKSEKISQLSAELDDRLATEAKETKLQEGQLENMHARLSVLQKELEGKSQDMEAVKMHILEAEQKHATKIRDLQESFQNTKKMLKLESERCNAVKEALKCSEEKALAEEARNQKRSGEMAQRLKSITEQLAVESAEKQHAQEQAALLQKRLASLEEAELKRQEAQRIHAARQQELAAEGFVHLGWDKDGVCAELDADDQDFEVLVDNCPSGR